MSGALFVEALQFRNDSVILYDHYIGPRRASAGSRMIGQFRQLAYSGTVSLGAVRRIRRTIDLLLQASPLTITFNPVTGKYFPFSINFITLTIPASVPVDNRFAYKELLKPFLRWLRSRGVEHYIWKVELQRRGQLHWHITTNRFVHYAEIQKQWNKILRRADMLSEFVAKFGHYCPNSTDVHSVRNIRNIGAYLSKYLAKGLSKDDGTAVIDGKVWDCSNSLKAKLHSDVCDVETSMRIGDAIKAGCKVIKLERCGIVKVKPEKVASAPLMEGYRSYLNTL